MLHTFETRHASLTPDRLVPVHGAPHMHQWLLDNDTNRLGLIDFDRFALGEIELDIATLLVELDYEDELTESPVDIGNAVVAGFRSAGLDVDRSRLRLYTAHKRMSKITREAWALRTNGERRARRHLPRIIEDLEW
jgi:aminoglycoside phosphotransferase (APT) family kinase protein